MTSSRYRRPVAASIEQREVPRHRVSIERATVKRPAQTSIEAQIRDISIYGCCLILDAVLRLEESIVLVFEDDVTAEAVVIWQEADRIGCRFAKPIDTGFLRSLTLYS